jgi:acyl transferase domain-containing protein/enoyl-CoA hydratase/carnithine racemase/acyl carrier protein/NAD(P)-dependent dehydrogenase (short-subunit alcohol dehydrogenase family)/SAM-dependent methyltransferase/ribosomal protein S18 acetylase RimI-like enzyme
MLKLLKFCCHGYVAVPVIEACHKQGLFALLEGNKFCKRTWLIKELKANEGYFSVALQALESLGWLEKNDKDAYRLTSRVDKSLFNLDLSSLYAINPAELVQKAAYARRLGEKTEKILLREDANDKELVKGAIITPLVIGLKHLSGLSLDNDKDNFSEAIAGLDKKFAQSVERLFVKQHWLSNDKSRLTAEGRHLLQATEFADVVACRPMLNGIRELLFGDAKAIHIGRKPELTVGQVQNGDHFYNIRQEIVNIFNQLPVEEQPGAVVSVCSADGTLLKEVYQVISEHTVRGQQLQQHQLLLGEIDKPGDITKQAVDHSLYPLVPDQLDYYLDQDGQLLSALTVLSHWQQHLRSWADRIGKSHLLVLEAHSLPVHKTFEYLDRSENFYFDTIHCLSHQYLISAEAFLVLAANVGLFNRHQVKRYPELSGFCRVSLHHLTKRDYIIRFATEKDIDSLIRLEELCWQEQLRTSAEQILARIEQYPQGQFVLEKDGQVLGVIYSQRIANDAELERYNAGNVHELHNAAGSIIQLIAVNIHPGSQNLGYGDQLLEFMLQRCSLIPGILRVVAVSLCKKFDANGALSIEQYIQQKGIGQDPILAFHDAHGARIVKPMPNYRPLDYANQGYGVLVAYDILNRVADAEKSRSAVKNDPVTVKEKVAFSQSAVSRFLQDKVTRLLNADITADDFDRPVMEMGLNSVDLMSLQKQIEGKFNLRLQPAFFFEYNSINKVIGYLSSHITADSVIQPVEGGGSQSAADKNEILETDIAIVGVSCRLPGGIESADELWSILAAAQSMIGPYPGERGDWPSGKDKPGIDHGGFLHHGDAFDASFFRMSPKEAQITDPQQRMLLELAWACLEDASIVPAALKGTDTGVFIGASNCDYYRLMQANNLATQANHAVGGSLAVLANRISYFFDFNGPSLTIDTACSASLVALHTAVKSLRSSECSAALVGGVNFICYPDLSIAYQSAGMLAPDSRCKVFDAGANGYVRSEGAVVLLLKPLHKAIEDNDHIHAVIKGSAVNHGGLAGGLTVPNPLKQSELYIAAWKNAGISPQRLSYIEAHGTGTSLGDPIEVQGIKTAYSKLVPGEQAGACGIGSVKSNLGHLESAAGITGLLKVILSMQRRQLPASINYEELNPKIHLQDTPFYIQSKLQPWEAEKPLLAGVSSFGSGGANAHVVVQEYVAGSKETIAIDYNLFVLSAASKERLKDYAEKIIRWSERAAGSTNFTDAIYSWQVGRTAMKHRLAVKAKDWNDLQNKLKQWLADGRTTTDIWTGLVSQAGSGIEEQVCLKNLEELALKWVSGVVIEWRRLYGDVKPKAISLPVYPFARERYWIEVSRAKDIATQEAFVPSAEPVQTPAEPRKIQIAPAVGINAANSSAAVRKYAQPSLEKPANVSLVAPGSMKVEEVNQAAARKGPVSLSNASESVQAVVYTTEDISHLELFDHGNGIYSIKINASGDNNLSGDLVGQLLYALEFVKQTTPVRVLMLRGTGSVFLQGGREAHNEAVRQDLYRAIASFPYPVIGVMQGNASGAGFLAGALCDFMVCSLEGSYSYTDVKGGLFPTLSEERLFGERFGEAFATDFLYRSAAFKGSHLKEKGWSCAILPAEQVETYAGKLALHLSAKQEDALSLLKRHLGRHILALAEKLTTAEALAVKNVTVRGSAPIISGAGRLKLETAAGDVLTIKIGTGNGKYELRDIVADLADVLARVEQDSYYKAIILTSDDPGFISVQDMGRSAEAARELQDLILNAPVPVIAAMGSGAKDIGWLIGQSCDVCVYTNEGVYSAAGISQTPELARRAAMIFSHRLGSYVCNEILLAGTAYTGVELQRSARAVTVVEKADVSAKAIELAGSWAALSLDEVKHWKRERAAAARKEIAQLPTWLNTGGEAGGSLPEAPAAIALKSKVIKATVHSEGIVEVRMEDREARNMFSGAFIEGITEVFAHIAQTPAYKVVILTGYDSYFSSGGTKEMLLDIQDGKIKFTDAKIYHLAMECKIPVIAAMQGHGIGAGWSMGMFADFILFSEESRYVSPYMNYGFTPGAGATLIFPDKTGYDLARETLLTAVEYPGSELKEKGLLLPVLSRKDLLSAAFNLAKRIAQNSRNTLIALKHQLTSHLQDRLGETYSRELAMHEKTFVGRPDTLKQIENNFYQEEASPGVATNSAERATASRSQNTSTGTGALPAILASLKTLLAQELHMQEDAIDENSQFVDLGLDSIIGVTFIRKINEKYGISINATKVYSYPNLAQFSRFVKEEAEKKGTLPFQAEPEKQVLQINKPEELQRSTALSSALRESSSAIAVIGMAGQFPEAGNVEEYWQNIARGKNCIREIPQKRWDIDKYFQPGGVAPGKTYSKWMGALEQYDLFDPMFFNISPSEAESMDPQQRLFLQTCWHAIEDAGYNARSLANSNCGVFVGCGQGDYHLQSRSLQISAHGFTGGDNSILAARISYFLDLQGPCLTIDTACSSSLVAIANACDSLTLGNSDLVLAGGVYIGAGSDMHIKTSQMGMLSPDGKCYTFDQRANGFVPGEGVGVVVLKRLEDAERDGDNILGVIQGWGVNQDGKTNGITAPNTEAQWRLQQEVYNRYKIDPAAIQLVEAHGTATKLGDPIEVEALIASFRKYTSEKQYCALGSVKSNIGHCLMAAGVAGMIKLLLSLKHKQLPPTINFEKLNEHISLDDSPFYVNTELRDWKVKGTERRQAAISSFGFSGTNAHLVIAEYPATLKTGSGIRGGMQNSDCIIPLSAKTEEQLKQKAIDLLDYIRKEKQSLDLAEVAYTLQVGRMEMAQRLGFVVSTIDQLAGKLQAYIEGKQRSGDIFSGKASRNEDTFSLFAQDADLQETIEKWIQQKKLSNLINIWVKGYDLDWNKLYGNVKPRRIHLPLYPFAKERYWIDAEEADRSSLPGAGGAFLHPLLHRNTSVLNQQRYSSIFNGEECFLNRDQVSGTKVLPGFAGLEMARAAIEHSLSPQLKSGILELHNIVWAEQMIAAPHTEFSISLYEKDNGYIGYEICSKAGNQEIIHSQGEARFSSFSLSGRIDIEQLKRQMKKAELSTDAQETADVYLGGNQLLARLNLSDHTMVGQSGFVLLPAIMEHTLQLTHLLRHNEQQSVTLSVRSVQIASACTQEMFVWIRFSRAFQPGDDTVSLDIDLCDKQGEVCIQIKELLLGTGDLVNAQALATANGNLDRPELFHTQEATQTLFFNEYWQEQPYTGTEQEAGDQQTVIFTDKGLSEKLAAETTNPLLNAVIVEQADNYKRITGHLYQCRPGNLEDINRLLDQVTTGSGKPIHIIYTWAKGRGETGVHMLFDLFKAVKALVPSVSRVTLVGHYNPSVVDTCWDYSWIGFERSLKLLLPNIQLSLLYTDEPFCTPRQLLDASQCNGVLWYKEGKRYELSLQTYKPAGTTGDSVLKQHGTYLITGGCGSLGLKFARYLAENYNANLLLVGRRQITPVIEEQISALKDAGAAEVDYQSVDVSDRAAMLSLKSRLPFELSGIIHAAGVESAEPFYSRSTADINKVLHPKAIGSMLLDEVFDQPSLDFICYFSSVSASLGDFGSCDYAVASRFQMAYSHYREQRGQQHGKTIVINWPLWQEGGMSAGDSEQTSFYLKSSGQEPLQTSAGIDIWHDILRSDMMQTLVMVGKPGRIDQALRRLYQTGRQSRQESIPAKAAGVAGKGWKPQYQGFSLKECITSDIMQLVSALTKISQNKLNNTENLADYGFDSITLSDFAKRLTVHFGLEVTPAIFFSAATINKLSEHFLQEHTAHMENFYSPVKTADSSDRKGNAIPGLQHIKPLLRRRSLTRTGAEMPAAPKQEPIAVIGISGRFPQAQTVDQFWTLLAEGRNAITEIPLTRWDWRNYFKAPGDTNNRITTNKGGFIHGVDEFDPLFFEISPREAEGMDPAERLLLMETYKAIEDARISPHDIRGEKIGVFVGMEEAQYDLVTGKQGITTSGSAMISSRLSYFLDFQGPVIATNTACSSGLVALHQAVSSLRLGECKAAIVAGVSLLLSPDSYVVMSEAGMLSEDGRCHSFSKHANGIGVGESVVVLMLKPLSAAIADGDPVYGTIKASGVNFDGKTNGVTAPNGDRQAELIEKIYTDYNIDTNHLSYIVTHGTGTRLGDPVEVNALAKAFKKLNGARQLTVEKQAYCALTSCKSNVGHTLAASGLVSVVNLLKAMQHRQIPASLNCEEENDYITWNNSPFFVNKKTREWNKEQGRPYLGAVSSFGRSGTNAHVVIEEYQAPVEDVQPAPVTPRDEKVMILLSARTQEQLQQRVRDLFNFISSQSKETIDLYALGYSLKVCREEFDVRLGFLVSSVTQLVEKMQAYLDGVEDIEDTCRDKVKRNQKDMSIINDDEDMKEAIDKWITRRKLSKLMELWVKGLAIDWTKFYHGNKPKRIALPTYPFARDRYWIDTTANGQNMVPGSGKNVLHPFVHHNTSDLMQQCYSSTFSGNEFFLTDYQYKGRKVLPAAVYLEMARAAVEMAMPADGSGVIELHHLEWMKPCVVAEDKNIRIALSADADGHIGYNVFSIEADGEVDRFQGSAVFRTAPDTAKLDVHALKSQMSEDTIEMSSLYSTLGNLGVNYGMSLQALGAIYRGDKQLLAALKMPATGEQTSCVLHPGIIEGVLQAAITLLADAEPLIPVTLEALTVVSACTGEMFAWVRYSPEAQPANGSIKLDIDLCDQQGNVAVIMEGLELARFRDISFAVASKGSTTPAGQLWDNVSYVAKWEEQAALPESSANDHKTILIVCSGTSSGFDDEILEYYGRNSDTRALLVRVADKTEQVSDREWRCGVTDLEGFQTCLQHIDRIDTLYFLTMPDQHADATLLKDLVYSHESNEVQFLRLVKYLKQNDKVNERVESYILTLDTHSINEQPSHYPGAGITGLAYSLAQGSYQFRVRNLDLSSGDLKTPEDRKKVLDTILREPPADRGEVFKIRSGKRYRQTLYKLSWDTASSPAIRQNGVYLIVGGSGTVGRIITRNLIEKYGAAVVWLGRSAATSEKVQAALQLFEEYKERLLYIQADATDLESMQQAVVTIKGNYPVIHGAIFSGMVFDFENSLDQTTEAEFRSIFDLKARGSWVFYAALEKEPLDFMCYFSSGQAYSFSGASKLSAYASGITYSDSFVHSIKNDSRFPVGIINWGFWRSTIEAIEENNDAVSTGSFDALEDAEGFKCFEQFVKELRQGRIHQVLCMKASQHIETLMNCSSEELISLVGMQAASSVSLPENSVEAPQASIKTLRRSEEKSDLEEWLVQLLFCQIDRMVRSAGDPGSLKISDLPEQCKILDKYIPWWNACLKTLNQGGFIKLNGDTVTDWKAIDTEAVWKKWQVKKEKYLQDRDRSARVSLVSDCLERLPDILQGNTLATDVIFPDSSMDKVEGVYKNNLLSDTFNEFVANAVVAYLQQRLQVDPNARLKILEIGAGTGGTSAIVFSRLKPFTKFIEKYTYTDLSKAFFFHAEKNYVPDNPYIQCQRLDIEQPVAGQGIEAGTYDLVIATNVLHATNDIRRSLRNAKAILQQGGYLLLNELSTTTVFSHLTFGLLDGWWLFKDAGLRMPGGPGLYPAGWKQVLQEEGFSSVVFPAEEIHHLGQQIILAQSDGVVRQSVSVKKDEQVVPVAPVVAKRVPDQLHEQVMVKQQKPAASAKPSLNIQEYVRARILGCLSGTLKIASDGIDPDIPFSDYGIDSILGVSFINQINTALSISLNTAVIFEHSSVNRLSRHVVGAYQVQIAAGVEKQPDAPVASNGEADTLPHEERAVRKTGILPRNRFFFGNEQPEKRSSGRVEKNRSDIAVVGMSGMFPKAADIDEFWRNLIQGVDGVDELPGHYLDQRNYFSAKKQPGKTRCKWGGVLDDRDCFDPLFFNISPKEAASMNPHQRLVLQESWKAIENAGYNPRELSGSQTGIYIGAEPTGYIGESFTGYSDAIIASRLSYILNLNGPSFVVNTGCSSSAVALHLACESLRNKETDLALAGGVNACLEQDVLIRLDEIEMLSPSGRCFTFDQAADGTIMSEGIGIVVLKRLEDAIEAGDRIYGLISGSGINQDGASNGITAPNGAAQEKLIVDIYKKFNIDPEKISYVEAHGTGTKLGDPVETNALVRAFRNFTGKKDFCAVGSAKSYIGHTAAAAGVIGLIRVLLSMQNNRIPKLLHFKAINPLIEFNGSPFYINTDVVEWKPLKGAPRMAAINSFGHSGTNAHLVVKEYIQAVDSRPRSATKDPVIVPLSAKTPEQLQQKAADLLRFIRAQEPHTINLTDMAFTLQVGREAMEERLGFIVRSVLELEEKLQAYVKGERTIENTWVGQARRNKDIHSLFSADVDLQEIIDKWIAKSKLSSLVDLWVKGLDLDWHKLYTAVKPNRIHLPSYPFAKERYWVNTSGGRKLAIATGNVSTVIHPMLHRNISDFTQQGYTTIFSGEEFFLRDHQVNGHKVLPAVAYLEMVRIAVSQASVVREGSFILELHNTAWLKPIVVEEHRQVSISLFENDQEGKNAGKIDFEIYCPGPGVEDGDDETIHCQGQAIFRRQDVPVMLDVEQLRGQMMHGKIEPDTIYTAFGKMGLDYGPAHRGVTTVYMGNNQLLAHIGLPMVVDAGQGDFTLHPSLMDCALQACIGLMVDLNNLPSQSLLPFALDSVSIISPCTREMFVWARYAQGSKPGDDLVKIDLDLCDQDGNICVQMRGFSSRTLKDKIGPVAGGASNDPSYDDSFYDNVIEKVLNNEISVEEAAELN